MQSAPSDEEGWGSCSQDKKYELTIVIPFVASMATQSHFPAELWKMTEDWKPLDEDTPLDFIFCKPRSMRWNSKQQIQKYEQKGISTV